MTDSFQMAKVERRTSKVPATWEVKVKTKDKDGKDQIVVKKYSLEKCFPKDHDLSFVVQQLTTREQGAAKVAVRTYFESFKAVEKMLSMEGNIIAEGIQKALDETEAGKKVDSDTVFEYNIVRRGVVSPKITHEQTVYIADWFPLVFRALYNEIMLLCGKGAYFLGESKASGKTS